MIEQTFWICSLAVGALLWGALGLRLALSVLLANGVLGLLRYHSGPLLEHLCGVSAGEAALDFLSFLYPLYWGLAFYLLRTLDDRRAFALPVPLRLTLGFALCLLLFYQAGKENFADSWRLFRATYFTEHAKRPDALKEAFAGFNENRRCLDSHATLLRLAMHDDDAAEMRVVLEGVRECPRASATLRELVKPLVDQEDKEGIRTLMRNGLKASSLIYSARGLNASLLGYAAVTTDNHDLVRAIITEDPEGAGRLPDLDDLTLLLEMRKRQAMLDLLRSEGVLAPADS